jgi:DNA polymerase III epsilon subunit-like protein
MQLNTRFYTRADQRHCAIDDQRITHDAADHATGGATGGGASATYGHGEANRSCD